MVIKMINNFYVRPTLAINGVRLKETGFLRYVSCSASSLCRINATHSDSIATPFSELSELSEFSEQWCKKKKAEIYKNKLPAIFEDMSKMKDSGYFAITNFRDKPLSFYSLNNIPGIYMITNKRTKKFYIGYSKNLKGRFYNYLDLDRLNIDKSPRIHRALIDDGYENFSISILELYEKGKTVNGETINNSFLREREDFFIKVFKPQYNIKRSKYNLDHSVANNYKAKIMVDIPIKIKNLLNDSLDPNNLGCNLISLKYSPTRNFYLLVFCTPKYLIKANTKGWSQGDIIKPIGFECEKIKSIPLELIITLCPLIDKELLDNFFPQEKAGFGKKNLKIKIKALKKAAKSKG